MISDILRPVEVTTGPHGYVHFFRRTVSYSRFLSRVSGLAGQQSPMGMISTIGIAGRMQTNVWRDVRVIAWVSMIIFFDFRTKVGNNVDKWSEDTMLDKYSLKSFLRDAETSPGEILRNQASRQYQFTRTPRSLVRNVLNKILGGVFMDLQIVSDITSRITDKLGSLDTYSYLPNQCFYIFDCACIDI